NFTTGFYEITSVDTGLNNWTVDRNCSTGVGSGMTGRMGGALASINIVSNGVAVAKNKIFVKVGTYTRTATTTISGGSYWFSSGPVFVIGYNTTRGDHPTGANRPIISLSTNSGLKGILITGTAFVSNLIIDCNSLTTSTGLETGFYSFIDNVTVQEFTSNGFYNVSQGVSFIRCEAKDGTSAASYGFSLNSYAASNIECWAHNNACPGFLVVPGGTLNRCLITNNTGALSDGVRTNSSTAQITTIRNCIIHGNGRDGINRDSYCIGDQFQNNIITSNGRYGINFVGGAIPTIPFINYNAFRNNTSGAKNNMNSTTGSYSVGSWTSNDITLTADPYTNAAGDDYTLNNTGGGGAACKAAGIPGVLPGAIGTGYLDIGIFQHQDPAGGTTVNIIRRPIIVR
ncbi:MAG: hypothetical protein AABY07_11015, partial [Nanoarchaeota archaeon]